MLFRSVQEQKKEEVKAPEPVAKEADSDKKSKKQKKKKDKKTKDSSSMKDSSKKKNDSGKDDKKKIQGRPKSGTKTFVVKGNGGAIAGGASETEKENSGSTSSAASTKMVYKIQLLASETEMDETDPAFCGLVPSGKFHENGMYKYTYGESESRREIEQKLLEVKSLIPDAFIVVRID